MKKPSIYDVPKKGHKKQFDGEVFQFAKFKILKDKANEVAKAYRKKGYLARTTERPVRYGFYNAGWYVWIRKKHKG